MILSAPGLIEPQTPTREIGGHDFDGDRLSGLEACGGWAVDPPDDAGEFMAIGEPDPPGVWTERAHQNRLRADGGGGRPHAMARTFSMTLAAVGSCSFSSGGL